MELNTNKFILYKLFNSSFTGLSIGILFTIYNPLDPSIYSIGGVVLAALMLILAKFYEKILNILSFFYISLLVEISMLATIIVFFILNYSLVSALLIYIIYQLTFVFGGYLVRAETLVVKEKKILEKIDVSKQIGYLAGLLLSFLFYQGIEYFFNIYEVKKQIYILHYSLMILQCIIIILLIQSFKKIDNSLSN